MPLYSLMTIIQPYLRSMIRCIKRSLGSVAGGSLPRQQERSGMPWCRTVLISWENGRSSHAADSAVLSASWRVIRTSLVMLHDVSPFLQLSHPCIVLCRLSWLRIWPDIVWLQSTYAINLFLSLGLLTAWRRHNVHFSPKRFPCPDMDPLPSVA